MNVEKRVPINADRDIVTARQQGRAVALDLGFSDTDSTVIAMAISEIARNIVEYAKDGEIIIRKRQRNGREGIMIEARDDGPGIPDVARAMEVGFSTSHGLGLGLPGTKRLMDDFHLHSEVGRGTTVVMTKWR
jgi:serine/threonine-protein kinase RsbT